jgi:hypothetical protein
MFATRKESCARNPIRGAPLGTSFTIKVTPPRFFRFLSQAVAIESLLESYGTLKSLP